ncbi:MAG: hypothetical protein ACM359_16995 [Bacillota bacterium]
MANAARVESLDALRAFRIAMCKFQEAANLALADAEGEVRRALVWLETEQQSYWQGQIRKRTELVARAKEAVRMKKVFKNSAGSRDSAVDEEKALAQAMRRLEEAEHKLAATRNWSKKLAREISLYTGAVQRFATTVQGDIPLAVTQLDRMVAALEAYLAFSAPGSPTATPSESPDTPPSTPGDDEPPTDNSQPPTTKQP